MNKRSLILIFSIALIIRVVYFSINYTGPDSLRGPDSKMYETLASNFLETGGFNSSASIPETERVPLYVAYLATFQFFAGNSPVWPVLGQIFIDAITTILIAMLAFRLNKKLGFVAGILAAINLNMISNSAIIFTDCIFLAFMTAMLLSAIAYFQRPSILNAVLTGLFLGLALLTRAVVMYYPPMLIIWIIIAIRHNHIHPGKAIRDILSCCLVLSLLIVPLLHRNLKQFGYFSLVTQTGTHTLNWIVPLVLEYSDGISFAESQEKMQEHTRAYLKKRGLEGLPGNPFERSEISTSIAGQLLIDIGPFRIAKAWFIGSAINLFSPALMSVPKVSRIERPSFYLTTGETVLKKIWNFFQNTKNRVFVILMVFAGCVTALTRVFQTIGMLYIGKASGLPFKPALFLIATAGYFLAVTGPITGVKYRLPFEPVLIIFLSAGLVSLYSRLFPKNPFPPKGLAPKTFSH